MKVDVDVNNPRVFEGDCLLERPSSLEGEACPDEADVRVCSTDVMVLTGSPRTRHDVSKAAERLSHLSFSPGLSLRRFRNDPSARVSPLSGRRADADSDQSRNQKSPEFATRYIPAMNAIPRKLAKPPHSPRNSSCSKGKLLDSADPATAIDATRVSRESPLLAKRSAEREEGDLPGEERAEAEGCEHTAVENLEDKVSFKGSNKLLDNDNVQTLRVIILSEQL